MVFTDLEAEFSLLLLSGMTFGNNISNRKRNPMKTNNSTSSAFRFAHDAMTTFNHIDIHHTDKTYAYSAAQEAFKELDRLELLLSRFSEGSDIWQINHAPADTKVLIATETYDCLCQSKQLTELTVGAFDITLGRLIKLWKDNASPATLEIESSLKNMGSEFLQISDNDYSVTKLKENLTIDLGAIGKGYIIDKMAEILEEWELECALISSGNSSFLALDPPPGTDGWNVVCGKTTFRLSQGSISASGMEAQGRHIINPRTGIPLPIKSTQWSMAPTAAIADAVSTAAMVMNPIEKQIFLDRCPEIHLINDA